MLSNRDDEFIYSWNRISIKIRRDSAGLKLVFLRIWVVWTIKTFQYRRQTDAAFWIQSNCWFQLHAKHPKNKIELHLVSMRLQHVFYISSECCRKIKWERLFFWRQHKDVSVAARVAMRFRIEYSTSGLLRDAIVRSNVGVVNMYGSARRLIAATYAQVIILSPLIRR